MGTQAPTVAPTTVGPVNNGTCNAGWIADNYCDDINNNPECEFDGGDCCQEDPAEGWNNYCEECECLDAPEPTTEAPMECAVPQWAGDNFCDDENNNPECGFDGGDCCDNNNRLHQIHTRGCCSHHHRVWI